MEYFHAVVFLLPSFCVSPSTKNSIVSDIFSVCFPQVDRLKAELMYERRTSEEHLSRFEDERRVWQEEKEKVKTKG